MNKLAAEKSPYLLQHRDNPVHWQTWSKEAFELAHAANKPIFLSIGYATCHWCHVMAHESFEDQEVAEILNDNFISIKVDREELPDVDNVYMKVVQGMTGHGGWPMTVILTPDLKPFFGGTYFRKGDLIQILDQISSAWKNNLASVQNTAKEIVEYFKGRGVDRNGVSEIDPDIFNKFLDSAISDFDPEHGGFGGGSNSGAHGGPKFPPSMKLQLLLRIYEDENEPRALHIIEHTLKSMAYGGIYDHLGGGFARYTTDEAWIIPHFEKMLYDNALLAKTYLESYQITKKELYRTVAIETLDYILRDMTSNEGGFYSAEDADSEGVEGKFYLWSFEELNQILTDDEFKIFTKVYPVSESGNFEGQNILTLNKDQEWNIKYTPALKEIHQKLLAQRNKRVRQLCDDKILTAWNGLMIDAMALGYKLTNEERFLAAAQKSANFIHTTLYKDKKLYRRYRDGEVKFDALLDDYAYLINGLLALYQNDLNDKWLTWAGELQKQQNDLFWDDKSKIYKYSTQKELIFSSNDLYDSAEPSSNGYAIMNLLKLSTLLKKPEYTLIAEDILIHNSAALNRYPQIHSTMILAYHFMKNRAGELVGVGI